MLRRALDSVREDGGGVVVELFEAGGQSGVSDGAVQRDEDFAVLAGVGGEVAHEPGGGGPHGCVRVFRWHLGRTAGYGEMSAR